MSGTHRYRARCIWRGSTGLGYERYSREHTVECPPAAARLTTSSDPAFRGDPALLNPEQLLLAAAVSCQLLAFLAVAARARIDVIGYEDEGEADMPEDDRPMRITAIRLRPRIMVPPGTDEAKVHRLVEIAHKECFIANSLTSEMDIEATVITRMFSSG
jgi:organic hydroperoxide reductase OsmC/OhrA